MRSNCTSAPGSKPCWSFRSSSKAFEFFEFNSRNFLQKVHHREHTGHRALKWFFSVLSVFLYVLTHSLHHGCSFSFSEGWQSECVLVFKPSQSIGRHPNTLLARTVAWA